MTNLAKYIAKSSQKFSKYINSKKNISNKHNCKKYIPQKIPLEAIDKSPIFKSPAKWISTFKFIDESQRIQSYKPLENSCMGHILSSPPRMTHASRTVVPKDLLIPFRVMENPFKSEELDNKQNKMRNFKYIIAPFHPKEKKVPEDPITYYPRNLSMLRRYSENVKSDDRTITLKKYSINNNEYPNITEWKNVGWNVNTWKVVEKIYSTQIIDCLKSLSPLSNETETGLILSTESNTNEMLSYKNDHIIIDFTKLKISNPELCECLIEKFPEYLIPINRDSTILIKELMRYCILIDDTTQ